MGCQRNLAEKIVDAEGQYVLTLLGFRRDTGHAAP
jgi:hypothetical protein